MSYWRLPKRGARPLLLRLGGALVVDRMDQAQRLGHRVLGDRDGLSAAVANADAFVGQLLIGGIVETGVEGL